jgi:transposase
MDGVVEIITGRERRRRWSTAEKLRIVAEAAEPGAVMRAVAARHGICESLLFTWRRQARTGALRDAGAPAFVPVQVFDAPVSAMPPQPCALRRTASTAKSALQSGLIEIELGDGRRVRVGRDVNLAALRRVLAALRG